MSSRVVPGGRRTRSAPEAEAVAEGGRAADRRAPRADLLACGPDASIHARIAEGAPLDLHRAGGARARAEREDEIELAGPERAPLEVLVVALRDPGARGVNSVADLGGLDAALAVHLLAAEDPHVRAQARVGLDD